jgi:signal peptidase I
MTRARVEQADPRLALLLQAMDRGHPQTLVAQGRSMLPALPPGSRVRLSAIRRDPVLGDVVAAWLGDAGFCIHRVVGVRSGPAWLLKGDNNPRPDGWVTRADLLAHVELESVTGEGLGRAADDRRA